jgi:hypothetical protein
MIGHVADHREVPGSIPLHDCRPYLEILNILKSFSRLMMNAVDLKRQKMHPICRRQGMSFCALNACPISTLPGNAGRDFVVQKGNTPESVWFFSSHAKEKPTMENPCNC